METNSLVSISGHKSTNGFFKYIYEIYTQLNN